jgi:uncharacterized damage-inducible protein DinB
MKAAPAIEFDFARTLSMTIAEILLLDFDTEITNTRRTLERIPEKDAQWKPHEKSMAIGRLAAHTARLPQFCVRMFTTPELDMDKEKMPDLVFKSTEHLLSELDRAAADARSHLAASSDHDLRAAWKLSFKGRVIVDAPRMVLYRSMFLNHLVHHRAQLGVYLRLLNISVPALYGPSADEPST